MQETKKKKISAFKIVNIFQRKPISLLLLAIETPLVKQVVPIFGWLWYLKNEF